MKQGTYKRPPDGEELLQSFDFTTSTSIKIHLKIRLYNTMVLPTVLYASETWKMKWIPPGGKRRRGSPRTTWRRKFQGDLVFLVEDDLDVVPDALTPSDSLMSHACVIVPRSLLYVLDPTPAYPWQLWYKQTGCLLCIHPFGRENGRRKWV